METQLDTFRDRVERISKMTSEASIAAETYWNDMQIVLSVVKAIERLNEYAHYACVLCESMDGGLHEEGCPLVPLYEKYTGLTYKLPRHDTRKGAWEEADRVPPHYEKAGNDRAGAGYVGNSGTPSTKQKVKGPTHIGGRDPRFKIWENGVGTSAHRGLMQFKGSPADMEKVCERYTRGGWIEDMRFEMGEMGTLVMSIEGSKLAAFVEEVRAEQAALREATLPEGD